MDANEFKEKYEVETAELDVETMMKNAAFHVSIRTMEGSSNIIVAIEECGELIQECCKILRGKGDRLHLIEEIADVTLAMRYLMSIFNITEEEIHKAMNVKIKRQKKRNARPTSETKKYW